MSRVRNTEYGTVHHLTSRIAHKAFFLKAEECDDLLKMLLRVSAFGGVELLGWCIMNNHFHFLVYLPEPPQLTDGEVLHRFALLKDDASRLLTDETGAEGQASSASSDGRSEALADLVKSIRRRMYSIAEFMRMVKQWFTEDYNVRNCHKGTMWEAPYGDHHLYLPECADDYGDLRDILAYIHLNPIRASIADRFDGYAWSSYTAYRNGDPAAVEAMRRMYPGMTDDEIVQVHEERMSRLLEGWKRKRAEELAHRRLAGYELPADPLTSECMIAQAQMQIEEAKRMVVELQLKREVAKGTKQVRGLVCRQILVLSSVYHDSTPQMLADTLKVPLRSVQRYVESLVRSGELIRAPEGLRTSSAAWGCEGQTPVVE